MKHTISNKIIIMNKFISNQIKKTKNFKMKFKNCKINYIQRKKKSYRKQQLNKHSFLKKFKISKQNYKEKKMKKSNI